MEQKKVVDEMLFDEYTIGVCFIMRHFTYLMFLDDARNTCADLLKNVTDNDVIEKTIKQVFEDKLNWHIKNLYLPNVIR